MSYYGQGLSDLGTKIQSGLKSIAEAIKAKPPAYNVVVTINTADPNMTEEKIAEHVRKALESAERRRRESGN